MNNYLKQNGPKTLFVILGGARFEGYRRNVLPRVDNAYLKANELFQPKQEMEVQKIILDKKIDMFEKHMDIFKKYIGDFNPGMIAPLHLFPLPLLGNRAKGERLAALPMEHSEYPTKIVEMPKRKPTGELIKSVVGEETANLFKGLKHNQQNIINSNKLVLEELAQLGKKGEFTYSQVDYLKSKNKNIIVFNYYKGSIESAEDKEINIEDKEIIIEDIGIHSPWEFEWGFTDLLQNASAIELGAFAHILLCLFVLFCLFTIVSVTYSDMLIDKYNLENKFPILVNIIRFRNEFKHVVFFTNVFLIVAALVYCIYINASILWIIMSLR